MEKVTILREKKSYAKMVTFPRVIQIYAEFANFARLYFRILQHFVTKLCISTNLRIIFLAMAKDFVLLPRSEVSILCKLTIVLERVWTQVYQDARVGRV